MFFVAVVVAAGYALAEPPPVTFLYNPKTWLLFGLGMINALAVYASWRAVDMSLSRTSLFTMMDDVVAMVLGTVVLGESKLITWALGIGIFLCFGSAVACTVLDIPKQVAKERAVKEKNPSAPSTSPWRLFIWIGIYSVIWGIAAFAVRYYALQGFSGSMFALPWYVGSFIGTLFLFVLLGSKEAGEPLTRQQMTKPTILGVMIIGSMMLLYWANHSAPIAVTQPIFQVAEMVIPTLMGLYYFKEIEKLTRAQKGTFVLALMGSVIVALSY
jgi:hypothetical protein